MKLHALLLICVAGLSLAATIEIGTAEFPSTSPWCAD